MHPRRCTRYALHVRSDPGSVRMAKSACDDYGPMAMALVAAPWVLGHSTDVQLKASNCPWLCLIDHRRRRCCRAWCIHINPLASGSPGSPGSPCDCRAHYSMDSMDSMDVHGRITYKSMRRPRPWDDGYGVALSKHCWIHPIRAPSERKATPQRA